MIGLVEFLKASGVEIAADTPKSIKIHLACWNGIEHPIDVYYAGRFQDWQEGQNRRNFECAQVVGLIDLGRSHWLFAGVFEILDCKPNPANENHFLYSTKLLSKQDDLVGRVVVHHKRSRASYIWHRPSVALPIVEIRRKKLTIAEFPGYNSVVISHSILKIITEQKIESWYGALANIKGIYLITDTSSGKQYVGKASGSDGIWQRWCSYVDNGHGGNEELKKLLKANGAPHVTFFQYSILEIADTHASEAHILRRESHWVDVLKSRKFGLNGGPRAKEVKNPEQ